MILLWRPAPCPPPPAQPGFSGSFSSVPEIGGTFLHQATSGEPQQRLLILYDKDEPETLQRLGDLLNDVIDVPAQQVVIEALIIEVLSDKARDLGISFDSTKNEFGLSFSKSVVVTDPLTGADVETGELLPFIFTFDKDLTQIATFRAKLKALVERGEAELLSNPSVLVLDGRQARIQIAQQVPVITTVRLTTHGRAATDCSSISYDCFSLAAI